MAAAAGHDLAAQAKSVAGVTLLAARVEGADAGGLREMLDGLKDKLKSGAIVLAAVDGDKVSLIAGVTADLTSRIKAGELVTHVATQIGGKGGGRPDMAQGGGTQPQALAGALESLTAFVQSKCGS
jgi:alanyl-tRNA synthetase